MEEEKTVEIDAVEISGRAKGGAARAQSLTPTQRSEIARKAAEGRWSKEGKAHLQRATHAGPLSIADVQFDCAVLEDGSRVVSETRFMSAMGMYRSGALSTRRQENSQGAQAPLFLAYKNLIPFVLKHLGNVHFEPKKYRTTEGNVAHGIPAEMIPRVCKIWRDADEAGVLGPRQKLIAAKSRMLLDAFAEVAIVALVDEATGYQYDRARDELSKILEAYIAPDLMPWTRKFSDEFFRQIYRIHGWEYKPGTAKRTPYVGKLINKYVYEKLPPGVLEELKKKNPVMESGYRKTKHYKYLTGDTGIPHLDRQLTAITTLMKISDTAREFEYNFQKAFGTEYQQRLTFVASREIILRKI